MNETKWGMTSWVELSYFRHIMSWWLENLSVLAILTKTKIPYELVVVNDVFRRPDMGRSQKAGEGCGNVTGVLFSRNFGKEAAIFAGLAQACGGVVSCHGLLDLASAADAYWDVQAVAGRLWSNRGVKADRGKEGFYIKNVPDFSMISCPRQLR